MYQPAGQITSRDYSYQFPNLIQNPVTLSLSSGDPINSLTILNQSDATIQVFKSGYATPTGYGDLGLAPGAGQNIPLAQRSSIALRFDGGTAGVIFVHISSALSANPNSSTPIGTAPVPGFFYASQIIPTTALQATFGGTIAYTFPTAVSAPTFLGSFIATADAAPGAGQASFGVASPALFLKGGAGITNIVHLRADGTTMLDSSVGALTAAQGTFSGGVAASGQITTTAGVSAGAAIQTNDGFNFGGAKGQIYSYSLRNVFAASASQTDGWVFTNAGNTAQTFTVDNVGRAAALYSVSAPQFIGNTLTYNALQFPNQAGGSNITTVGASTPANVAGVGGSAFLLSAMGVRNVLTVDYVGNCGISGGYFSGSKREAKKDIARLEVGHASRIIDSTTIFRYAFKGEAADGRPRHIGFMGDDTHGDISAEGQGMDLNATIAVVLQALKETRAEFAAYVAAHP